MRLLLVWMYTVSEQPLLTKFSWLAAQFSNLTDDKNIWKSY